MTHTTATLCAAITNAHGGRTADSMAVLAPLVRTVDQYPGRIG